MTPKLIFTNYPDKEPEFHVSGDDNHEFMLKDSLKKFNENVDLNEYIELYNREKELVQTRKILLQTLKDKYKEFVQEEYPELIL